jgi:hypothetical protein
MVVVVVVVVEEGGANGSKSRFIVCFIQVYGQLLFCDPGHVRLTVRPANFAFDSA